MELYLIYNIKSADLIENTFSKRVKSNLIKIQRILLIFLMYSLNFNDSMKPIFILSIKSI